MEISGKNLIQKITTEILTKFCNDHDVDIETLKSNVETYLFLSSSLCVAVHFLGMDVSEESYEYIISRGGYAYWDYFKNLSNEEIKFIESRLNGLDLKFICDTGMMSLRDILSRIEEDGCRVVVK